MEALKLGAVVAGRYSVLELVGTGTATVVHRAHDVQTGRDVALKVLVGGRLQEQAAQRFQREAEAYRQLQHDGVVEILDVGTTAGGQPFIAMEYVTGGTLEARLERAPLTPQEVHALAQRMCSVLSAVHALGMVHGDVKPANIFLPGGDLGRAKLGDFGLVEDVAPATGLTQTGVILGTPYYMSPEQVQGQSRSAASDVWALGVVLYECAYGRRPFEGSAFTQVMVAIVTAEPELPPLPGGLEQVLGRALHKDPKQRFTTMDELARALAERGVGSFVSGTAPAQHASGTAPAQPAVAHAPFDAPAVHARGDKSGLLWGVLAALVPLLLGAGLVLAGVAAARVWRLVFAVCAAVGAGSLGWVLIRALLERLEAGRTVRSERLRGDVGQLRRRSDARSQLSSSVAVALDALLADSRQDPMLDVRRASMAWAIEGFESARDRDEQQVAFERMLVILDKLQEQIERSSRPWYARHKEGLTLAIALVSAAAALISSLAAALD